MIDTTALNAAVSELADTVTATVGTDASAAKLIDGIGDIVTKAVQKALEEDDAADQGTADAATAAIKTAIEALKTSSGTLGTAVANSPA